MRRILVDNARRKNTVKHGGEFSRVPGLPESVATHVPPDSSLVVHELVDRLAVSNPRQAEVAKLRVFLEMTFVEIAQVLGMSADTAEADWAYARAWLKQECQSG